MKWIPFGLLFFVEDLADAASLVQLQLNFLKLQNHVPPHHHMPKVLAQ